MKWESLLEIVDDEPVFSSGLLLSGRESATQVRLQLSRWVKSGRLIQLRRGLYAFARAWRKIEPHPFLVANRMQHGSYVSRQSALAYHGVIPEYVPVVTSVSPGRSQTLHNPLGAFDFRHLSSGMLYGYSRVQVGAAGAQYAFVASAEKALLDLAYLTPRADSNAYLQELRLQDSGAMNIGMLAELAERSRKPKLIRTASAVRALLSEEGESL